MSKNQDERLDQMLKSRRVAAASPDLVQRIILKAANLPQIQTFSLVQWLRRTFNELHLPNPAYLLAGTLIMGFVLGFNVPLDTGTERADIVQPQSFFDTDEGLL